ncbi:MAG: hypothetical protein ACI8TQ_001913, partial [Planctomycetota bacterium]
RAERLAFPSHAPVDFVLAPYRRVTYRRGSLLQKGELSSDQVLNPDSDGVQNATAVYGIGAWAFCNGDGERANELWKRLAKETPWNAFGHICAEAELNR